MTTVAVPPRVGGARRWWRIVGSLFAIAAFAWGGLQLVNAFAHGEHTHRYTFSATAVDTIDVSTDAGDIRVVPSDRSDIAVTVGVSDGLLGTDRATRVTRGRLVLSADCPLFVSFWCKADYTVQVPRSLVSDLDVRSTHGDVTATALRSADAHAASDHGDVSLRFRRAPRRVEATSEHGDVDVVVPRDGTAYQVEFSTGHGDARSSVRTDPTSGNRIDAHSDHGDVTVRYGSRPASE
jgi:hypothetical protein